MIRNLWMIVGAMSVAALCSAEGVNEPMTSASSSADATSAPMKKPSRRARRAPKPARPAASAAAN